MRMATRQRKKSVVDLLLVPVAAIAITGYFVWHAFQGDHGILARERMEARAAELSAVHARLVEERTALERRVHQLRPESLDADLVEERARANLSFANPDEIVIFLARGASQSQN